MMSQLLKVNDLAVSFNTYNGEVQAVRGVSFTVHKGETLAIVGESGSGKSVTTKALMRLLPKRTSVIKRGEILFEGEDLVRKSSKEMQKIRGQDIAMIFQDPMTSLNPTMKIGNQIMEGLLKHRNMSRHEAKKKAIQLLQQVGIPHAEKRLHQYPHQFSGGMRQRVVIAMALACSPKLLIADEPTTALDVTIQAQILDLLKHIQKEIGTAIIFITHDLGVVANIADSVAVMYAGRIVEKGTVEEIFYHPTHPYNSGLLKSMPNMETSGPLYSIPGSPPDMTNPPSGDAFAARNEYALAIDYEEQPPMFQISDTHAAATWLLHPQAPEIDLDEVQTGTVIEEDSKAAREDQEILLETKNLKKHFKFGPKQVLKALDGVSLE